ncbi:hypothetical protein [Rhodoferax sp.]|uniref:hypothetical protein n=1 Tax=Rhodoferax sp. TaxID=50421 RepID=UPI0025D53F2B|nr:hypothetical protein [Rhodoferax sp.]MCM2296275.1 hypothetical protein [Rhodoferax sp.]
MIRRGFDGTATVELRWDTAKKRRILFVKGEPLAADVPQSMTSSRDERGWRATFNGDEQVVQHSFCNFPNEHEALSRCIAQQLQNQNRNLQNGCCFIMELVLTGAVPKAGASQVANI